MERKATIAEMTSGDNNDISDVELLDFLVNYSSANAAEEPRSRAHHNHLWQSNNVPSFVAPAQGPHQNPTTSQEDFMRCDKSAATAALLYDMDDGGRTDTRSNKRREGRADDQLILERWEPGEIVDSDCSSGSVSGSPLKESSSSSSSPVVAVSGSYPERRRLSLESVSSSHGGHEEILPARKRQRTEVRMQVFLENYS